MKKEKLTKNEAMIKAGEIIDGAGGILCLFIILITIDVFLSIAFHFDQLGNLFTIKGILIAISSWKGMLLLILTYFSAILLLVWLILLTRAEILMTRVENGKYKSY
jgi:hypothetical protein